MKIPNQKYLMELEDVIALINDRYKKDFHTAENIGELRLQLSVYLLYAYYGSRYGSMDKVNILGEVVEIDPIFPKELCKVTFKSGSYGVTNALCLRLDDTFFDTHTFNVDSINLDTQEAREDLYVYLELILHLINDVDDFSLVDRVHQDKVWFKSFHNNRADINNEELIKEYYDNYWNEILGINNKED